MIQMLTAPYPSPVDCKLLYTAGDRVLLALRQGTGYADGQWNLPSGRLGAGKMVDAAVCREAREEVGVHLHRHGIGFAAAEWPAADLLGELP